MTASSLLAELRSRDARVSARTLENGEIGLVVAPRGVASDLKQDITRLKPQLIELLALCQSEGGVPADVAALEALARARNARRFDFKQGERVFSPSGKFVCLNAALRELWRQAEAATGERLSVWGVVVTPTHSVELPKGVFLPEFNQMWNRAERATPQWGEMSHSQRLEYVCRCVLIEKGLEPTFMFSPSPSF